MNGLLHVVTVQGYRPRGAALGGSRGAPTSHPLTFGLKTSQLHVILGPKSGLQVHSKWSNVYGPMSMCFFCIVS